MGPDKFHSFRARMSFFVTGRAAAKPPPPPRVVLEPCGYVIGSQDLLDHWMPTLSFSLHVSFYKCPNQFTVKTCFPLFLKFPPCPFRQVPKGSPNVSASPTLLLRGGSVRPVGVGLQTGGAEASGAGGRALILLVYACLCM